MAKNTARLEDEQKNGEFIVQILGSTLLAEEDQDGGIGGNGDILK